MRLLVFVLLSAWLGQVAAHKASDSYLNLVVEDTRVIVQWDIALRDLDFAIGIDSDGDGAIRWGEIRARKTDLVDYSLARLTLAKVGAPCIPGAVDLLVDTHTDGGYAVLRYAALCARQVGTIEVDYRLFAALDPQHRGLLRATINGTTTSAVFGPARPRQSITVEPSSRRQVAWQYLVEGLWHILIGYDHILFLLSLLLPAVAWRVGGSWQLAANWRTVWIDVLKTITAFTVAHSITLALAALNIVTLPSRAVESVIAGSVALAALDNLFSSGVRRRWKIAFAFGLVHGFGFAGVLQDLGLPAQNLLVALLSFNLGVELGQLALVAAFLPLAYWLRASVFYRRGLYQAGSTLIVVIALGWFIERAAAIDLPLW